ncbi:MAG: NAD(P)-dependent glycerol-3-phosphate dehydrogenase [Gammaproteobacteria bacterium]|nr:NAD(P)-dependent glycerol-3-phosphate dehydrogenase [Gammaproteobacteria bacterium]
MKHSASATPSTLCVLGAGAWGTALAVLLARNNAPILLWGHNAEHMTELAKTHSNERFLPGVAFPNSLQVSADLMYVLSTAHDCLVAVPSHAFREMLTRLAPYLKPDSRVAWATKGLEPGSGKLLHEVAQELLGARATAVISGPTFAREVAAGSPTALTVASATPHFAADLAARLHNDTFRAYTSDDVIGVELGGAIKNVLAIAAGIADGLGYGANTRAALITRGLAEMMRLGVALGGKRETFMGLAGLGDLVLTCTDDQSRNRRLGLALARGTPLADALRDIGQIVEGVPTAREVMRLAKAHGIEMPRAVFETGVLHEGKDPRAAVQSLLQREQKAETI